jgi:hypothetical protein
MTIKVIGAGLGHTGTYSLKLAINQLGLGPCHHMETVLHDLPNQVPLWTDVLHGQPDWEAIYRGFESAVDWPTAGFFRELIKAYPSAKFVLTLRDPAKWADSFAATIYKLLAEKEKAPPEKKAWLEMAGRVIGKTGFPEGLDHERLISAFAAHNEAVKAEIPASQPLVYQVKDGWGPLCRFLGVPVPAAAFPQTNHRAEFWDRVTGKI